MFYNKFNIFIYIFLFTRVNSLTEEDDNKFNIFIYIFLFTRVNSLTEEDEGVKYANRCEVCKILAIELENRLEETGKSHDVIETGYAVDDVKPKKKKEYKKSELRLVESLDGVCDKILEYNIHKERKDSTRFAKGVRWGLRQNPGI
ncbi:TLR4 regulator and MIR-interacting MSAP [Popillia japonica]|uniref:TLR4 regulator and MIR-interacting MSAP n=1 Tax=Popillia japonica TaxID=7064 RepID=A0AAW1KJP7_POPJA